LIQHAVEGVAKGCGLKGSKAATDFENRYIIRMPDGHREIQDTSPENPALILQ
jgi:hypothetical protein